MQVNARNLDNLLCLRALTSEKLQKMHTFNYRGFVGVIKRKGDFYVITQITGSPHIAGAGESVEDALSDFQRNVRAYLRETAKDSQKKMLVRRFAKMEALHKHTRELSEIEIKRRLINEK